MTKEIENKLEIISNIYSHYILSYKRCRTSTLFKKDKPAYSFSDIMSYLGDTLGVIAKSPKIDGFSSSFAYHISLLQAIYVQQDLILELLYLVNCHLDKGDLKTDSDYNINRDIRNELIGHPSRKTIENNKTILLSSVLMDIHSNSKTLTYARYHKENQYQFEKLTFEIQDIIDRHYSFLNRYLDVIITKFKKILNEFSERVSNLLNLVDQKPFELIIKLTELHFESIFESRYCYDPASLIQIYNKKEDNPRYDFFIETFIKELKGQLTETLVEIPYEFEEQESENIAPKKNITYKIIKPNEKVDIPLTYHYELGKLATKRNKMDFEFFSGFLRDKCKGNKLIHSELDHMENNVYNEIEYYTSLNLIRKKLLK